jgi:hypothetical protein
MPGQKLDRLDFQLKRAPHVEEMKDDALTAAYLPQERLYLNFTSGQFSPNGTSLAIVAGDILSGDPEQVWRYDLQSQQLIVVTDKPTQDTSPIIQHIAWADDVIYVDGVRRAKNQRFVVRASAGKVEEITAPPAEVAHTFKNEDAAAVGVGSYVVTAVRLHGGDTHLSARKVNTGAEFTVAAAMQGTPIYDVGSATVFYPVLGWYSKIVAFNLNTRRTEELDLPRGSNLTLLAAKQEKDGFLIAYAVLGSCTIEETPDGEDPWILPINLEFRRQHHPTHVCFTHFQINH